MKIGASTKGLSCNVIPYAHSWLGFTRVWSMVSHIQIDSLRIRIVVYPVSGFLYAVSAWTIGTSFMVSYLSVCGAKSHSLPIKCMTMQLEPQNIESACESRSIVMYTTDTRPWASTFLFPYLNPEILRLVVEWILAMLRNPLFFPVVRLGVMNRQLTK